MDNLPQTKNINPPSRNIFRKIIFVVLGILVLVVIAEGVYYLYSTKIFNGPSQITDQSPAPSSSEIPVSSSTPNPKSTLQKGDFNFSELNTFTDSLTKIQDKSSFFDKLLINYEVSGIVNLATSATNNDNPTFIYVIKITNDQGQQLTVWFTANELTNATVNDISTPLNQNKKTSIDQIVPGDRVSIESTINLLSPSTDEKTIINVMKAAN